MRSRWLILFLIWTVGLLVLTGALYYWIIRLNGLTITSWWRSPWRNAAVGGKPWSQHQYGFGFDVVPVSEKNRELLAGLGLKVIDEGDHLHAQIL